MIRDSFSGLALVVTFVVMSAGFVFAASLSVSPTVGPPTTKATATGSGFAARETVNLTFDSAAVGSATTNGAGSFKKSFLVPKSAQPGVHTLKATGQTSGIVASSSFSVQTDWPSFKNGPARLGVNTFENTINKKNAIFLTLAWVGIMGDLVDFSSPAVVNGVVYVGSFDGKLYAFNANGCSQSSCQPLWTGQAGSTIYQSGPAVSNGVVYIGSYDGDLYAFSAAGCGQSSCAPLWHGHTSGIIEGSPAVAKNVVYIGSDDLLYAFKADGCGKATCSPLWFGMASGQQGAIVSAPAIANGLVYASENNGMVMVFNAAGCSQLPCLPVTQLLTNNEPIVSSSPAVVNGTVYVGSADQNSPPVGRLYVYKLSN